LRPLENRAGGAVPGKSPEHRLLAERMAATSDGMPRGVSAVTLGVGFDTAGSIKNIHESVS